MQAADNTYLKVMGALIGILMLLVAPSWGQEAERIGTVLVATGVVEVRAEGSTEWEPLRFRDAIFRHDTVQTHANSKIKILMRDDSILTLGEKSTMAFTEFVVEPQMRHSVVHLLLGTLKVITTRFFGAGSSLEVHTPNTVAGVRGTTFIIRFTPPDTTEIFVLDGVVTARNLRQAIPELEPIPPHTRTSIVGTTPPAKPVAIAPETLQPLVQELQVTEQIPTEVMPTSEQAPSTPVQRGEGAALPESARERKPAAPPPTIKGGAQRGPGEAAELPTTTEVPVDLTTQTEAIPGGGKSQQPEIVTPDTTPSAEEVIKASLVRLTVRIPRARESLLQLTIQLPR